MTRARGRYRRIAAALIAGSAMAVAAAGCGRGSNRVPDLAGLPLPGGAKIVTRLQSCDPGANAYCSYDLVVVGDGYASSQSFLQRERAMLRSHGWTGADAPNGDEHAADSPSGKLHVVFATPSGDLKGLELGWITRAPGLARSLSHTVFDHVAAMSMRLQFGSG